MVLLVSCFTSGDLGKLSLANFNPMSVVLQNISSHVRGKSSVCSWVTLANFCHFLDLTKNVSANPWYWQRNTLSATNGQACLLDCFPAPSNNVSNFPVSQFAQTNRPLNAVVAGAVQQCHSVAVIFYCKHPAVLGAAVFKREFAKYEIPKLQLSCFIHFALRPVVGIVLDDPNAGVKLSIKKMNGIR